MKQIDPHGNWYLIDKFKCVRRYDAFDADNKYLLSLFLRYELANSKGTLFPQISVILEPWSFYSWQQNPRLSIVRSGRPENLASVMAFAIPQTKGTALGVVDLEIAEDIVAALRSTQDLDFIIRVDSPMPQEQGGLAPCTLTNDIQFRELQDQLYANAARQTKNWMTRFFGR